MPTKTFENTIAALEVRLAQPASPQAEIDTLTQLAWKWTRRDKQRAAELYQKAFELSQSGEFADEPYKPGLAAVLAGRAFLSLDAGNYDHATAQCFETLALLEDQPPMEAAVNAKLTLVWIYYYTGDGPKAMNLALQALTLAQALGHKEWEANAYDSVACLHTMVEDFAQAIPAHQAALRMCREAGYVEREPAILANLAETLSNMHDYAGALEAALKGLQLAQQRGIAGMEILGGVRVADTLVEMGEPARARPYLEAALLTSQAREPDIFRAYIFESLGRVCLALNEPDGAESNFEQALALAHHLNALGPQISCHTHLTDLYERQGEYARALEHHRRFHALKEKAAGEESARRLAVLKVAYDVEAAQREAEIYRLRNVDLQREIDERKRVEAELERMATQDSLTGLNNRRHFMALAQRELERAVRYNHPFSALILDLDHFKHINDTYGHGVGDQVLVAVAALIRETVREVDVAGRYGGEEFAAVLPETDLNGGQQAGERLREAISGAAIATDAGPLTVTASIGVTSLPPGEWDEINNLTALLQRADQALYAAKRDGRNRTMAA